MEEKKNNKKKIIIIVSILVLVSIIGGTLAYFMARATSSEQTITSANLKIVFDDSTPIINATDIEPIEEENILTNAAKKTFRISKESNTGKDLYARIDMVDLNISDNFKDYDLKWALYEGTNKITTGTFVPTKDGSTSINMATNVLLNSTTPKEYNLYIWINETGLEQTSLMDGSLKGKISVTAEAKKLNTLASNILSETVKDDARIVQYKEKIQVDYYLNARSESNKTVATSYTFDSTTGKYTLTGTINQNVSYSTQYVDYYTCNSNNTVCDKMYKIKTAIDEAAMARMVDTYSTIKHSKDRGLFVQKDDNEKSEFGFPTYYYRGSSTNETIEPEYTLNNYVSFGTYKSDITNKIVDDTKNSDNITDVVVAHTNDPILWRIVRINEDGSIRLIAEHNTGSNNAYNSQSISKYINDDGSNSEAKNSVENWYTSNITESNLDSKIQMSGFCSDTTGLDYSSTALFQENSAHMRIEKNNTPIFKCPNGSLIATEKVGLITADELVFSGALYREKIEGNQTYLHNNTRFWTMTPSTVSAIINWHPLYGNTSIHNYAVYASDSLSSRAVINLKADTIISSGTGTSSDPYIIQ